MSRKGEKPKAAEAETKTKRKINKDYERSKNIVVAIPDVDEDLDSNEFEDKGFPDLLNTQIQDFPQFLPLLEICLDVNSHDKRTLLPDDEHSLIKSADMYPMRFSVSNAVL